MALSHIKSSFRVINSLFTFSKHYSSLPPKVSLIGACGGIGQPLSLLLKLNPSIGRLALFDITDTTGIGADLSHIDTPATVTAYHGEQGLHRALRKSDIVVIPAGVPRKPGMTRNDLFQTNARIVKDLSEAAVKVCPDAFVAIITNPINSTVPIAYEVFKRNGIDAERRIFGVTYLDVIRSQCFMAKSKCLDVTRTTVPVIGGHSGTTIIPCLSQTQPPCTLSEEETKELTARIQNAGTEVVKAKAGAGSATLSMAAAAARFINGLIQGLEGKKNVKCAYVRSDAIEGVEYFSTPLELGPDGVEKILGVGQLNSYEQDLLKQAIPELRKAIAKGVKFVQNEC